MDSKPTYLTGNTSTLYVIPVLDLKIDGPTVLEVPADMLGAFNDAWFRYLQDVGPLGSDKRVASTPFSRPATRAKSRMATTSYSPRPTGSGCSCGARSRVD
ncbi:MAG TPA: DUF1254 domain-containing protein [Myxococcales bacterium]|nr:DUF1254 domain-containing protein [Myxococcales bacterium]HIK85553.1 DUF1254 domain-containing protein [Myxococcales bacterium]